MSNLLASFTAPTGSDMFCIDMNKFLDSLQNASPSHAYCLVGGKDTVEATFNDLIKLLQVDISETYIENNALPIAQARELVAWLAKRPLNGKYKLIYLDLEVVSNDALTTLLKTIEEPPEYALIVLRASNIRNVLGTVKSRCQVVWLGENIKKTGENTQPVKQNSLETFLKIPDLLKEDTAENILDTWILKEATGARDGKKIDQLNNLLKIKEFSQRNTNSRLLLEYAILSGGVE